MPTVILARHGRTAANATGILAGRTPGIALDEVGVAQASAAATRLAGLDIAAAYTSPLERCKQTAALLLDGTPVRARVERGLNECEYGDWSGRPSLGLRACRWTIAAPASAASMAASAISCAVIGRCGDIVGV